MRNRSPMLPILSLCFLLLLPRGLAADAGGPEEKWFVVKIAGAPVGFASETRLVGEQTIVVRSHTDLSMKRMGTPLSMS